MTLTTQHVETLTAPFEVAQHEFVRGFVYLTEQAICTRLDQVDPAWSFEIIRTDWRAETVIVYARLTVGGVTRESTGEDTIEYLKKAERTPENVANHPEKAATTDALKRCARLFGVGRYLLDAGKGVTDHNTLAAWLNPFQSGAVQAAIRATLKSHGLGTKDGSAFILANIIEGRGFDSFSDLHPFLTPDDVMKRIPQLAREFRAPAPQPEEVEQPTAPSPLEPRSFAAPPMSQRNTGTRSSASTSPSPTSSTSRAAPSTAGTSTAPRTATNFAPPPSVNTDAPF
jgi:hypothetical protein